MIRLKMIGLDMTFLDKTFCQSPNCKNDCGRQMTDSEKERLSQMDYERVSYGYFCGEQEKCVHVYKKTIAKSGMNFIMLCNNCMDSKPYIPR